MRPSSSTSDDPEDARAPHFVQSLERGLAVIRAFDEHNVELTLSDVARSTGLTRAAARRFLLTLADLGYVRTDGRWFSLSPRVLELGYAYLSSLSLPGLSPFVSELLVMVGAFVHSPWAAVFAVPGIVLAAIYILWMYQRTMTGPVREGVVGMRDLNLREISALAPLLLLIVVLGFFPQPLLDVINPAVKHTMSEVGATDPPPSVTESEARE